MTKDVLDCNGMKCPQPVLKLAIISRKIQAGTLLEVLADCPQFPSDIRKWCDKEGKVLIACNDIGGGKFRAEVQF